jgi:alkylation response protein AidB-like acyl-CoA dehydrogenase
MDFNLSPEDEAFRRELRNWLEANLPESERVAPIDFMFEESDEQWQRRLRWHQKMHAAGWVGISWPREYGGRGASLTQQLIFADEISRARAPRLVNTMGIMMVGPTLIHWGTE